MEERGSKKISFILFWVFLCFSILGFIALCLIVHYGGAIGGNWGILLAGVLFFIPLFTFLFFLLTSIFGFSYFIQWRNLPSRIKYVVLALSIFSFLVSLASAGYFLFGIISSYL